MDTLSQSSDSTTAMASANASLENSKQENSVLHLRLSFSSNGIQLLPPYLERPVQLGAEHTNVSSKDVQHLFSLLSNLSSPSDFASLRPSAFDPPHPSAPFPSAVAPPHPLNGATLISHPSPSPSQPAALSPPHSQSLEKITLQGETLSPCSPKASPPSPPPRKIRSASNPPSVIPPHHSPPHPSPKEESVSPILEHHVRKEKRSRSPSSRPNEKGASVSRREEPHSSHSSRDFDQVSITFMNLPFQATREELQNFFEACGRLKQCQFLLNPNKTFRGIAHVVYENPESAKKALLLHNTNFRGREVSVCHTDYSLINRNSHHISSKDSPDLSGSRHKRTRNDHYSSTVANSHPLNRKAFSVLLENLPLGLSLDQIHDEGSRNGNLIRVDWANRSKTSAVLEYSRHDSAKAAVKRLDKQEVKHTVIGLHHEHSTSSFFNGLASFVDSRQLHPARKNVERKRPFLLKISELSDSTTELQIREFFNGVGPIERLRLSHSRNAAYLEVAKDEVASAILAKNGQMLSGNIIKIMPYHENKR